MQSALLKQLGHQSENRIINRKHQHMSMHSAVQLQSEYMIIPVPTPTIEKKTGRQADE